VAVQIHINTHDGVPIYLQVVNQIKYLVSAGRLTAGDELPPIRVTSRTDENLVEPNRPTVGRIGPNGFFSRGPYQTDPSTERSAPNFESKGTTP